MKELGLRARAALALGRLARFASRVSGRGSGGMIGGSVAEKIDPQLGQKLAANKRIILVTGTNGKSTTTKMLRAALATHGPVASNIRGDNMYSGVLTALMDTPQAENAAIEVDELHLGNVAKQLRPAGFVLLNLSRDQLDRTGEIGRVEKHLRETLAAHPDAFVVANCDDPLIASAAWDAPHVTWVAAGCGWTADSVSFPRTGTMVVRKDADWYVLDHPEYRRPQPDLWLDGEQLRWRDTQDRAENCAEPGGTGGVGADRLLPLQLQLPGRANLGNAAQAVAAAHLVGITMPEAVRAVGDVTEVAGRYARTSVKGRDLRVLLAKNPAGWQEAISMLSTSAPTIIVGVNGQVPDGKDLSWLWDVNFEHFAHLEGQRVIACGERGADLAVRLRYAGCPVELVDTPAEAVRRADAGAVDMLLNYTAFRDFNRLLERQREQHGRTQKKDTK